jgi:hypothetical protein
MRPLTFEEYKADNRKMVRYICEHLPADEDRIILADGPEGGPVWADLTPIWDDEYGWDLLMETNLPEWVDLRVIYQHFRSQEMTNWEWLEGIALRSQALPGTGSDDHTPATTKPYWDADLGRLWVGDLLIKQYTEAAENQRRVLDAFQEMGFRQRIDDPTIRRPSEPVWSRRRRRRDTIAGLNDDHVNPGIIYFRGDGTGDGIIWDWCE